VAASDLFNELVLHWAKLPDNPGAGDLDERTIAGTDNMRVRTGIAHRAVIHDIGAPIRAEPEIGRTVEPVNIGSDERLVAGAVAGILGVTNEWSPVLLRAKFWIWSESGVSGSWLKLISLTSWPITGAGAVAFSGENPKSPPRCKAPHLA
jgi:hypothetical protein